MTYGEILYLSLVIFCFLFYFFFLMYLGLADEKKALKEKNIKHLNVKCKKCLFCKKNICKTEKSKL